MDQILIRILGFTYSFIALPAMAIIAVVYYIKKRSIGGMCFSLGAIATAIGSMFNQFLLFRLFVDPSTGTLSHSGKMASSIALIIHFAGFLTMVAAWGVITFNKE